MIATEPRVKQTRRKILGRRLWTPNDDLRLRKFVQTHDAAKIGRLLKRTPHAIYQRAKLLGIGLQKTGEHHPDSLYSDDDVRKMLHLFWREGLAARKVAVALGFPEDSVRAFVSGKRRPHLHKEFNP